VAADGDAAPAGVVAKPVEGVDACGAMPVQATTRMATATTTTDARREDIGMEYRIGSGADRS
jgi:hypothetical protein